MILKRLMGRGVKAAGPRSSNVSSVASVERAREDTVLTGTGTGGGAEGTKGLTGVASLQRRATVSGRTPEHLYFALSPTQLLQATATEGTIVSQPPCRRAPHFTAT